MRIHSIQFEKKFLNTLNESKSSIQHPFKSLQALGLVIAESDDSSFRIYSWRSNPCDSTSDYTSIFQWLQYDTVRAELKSISINGQTGCYIAIHRITDELNTFYLANFLIDNRSNQPSYQAIHVMDFERNKLNIEFKKIKTKNGLTHRIAFYYDPASIIETSWTEFRLFQYNAESTSISFPVVVNHGQVRQDRIVYIYDGDYFIKPGN